MNLITVDELPVYRTRKPKRDIKALLEEFLNMGVKYVKVELEPSEYDRVNGLRSVLVHSCKAYAFPINVMVRGGDIYLGRR